MRRKLRKYDPEELRKQIRSETMHLIATGGMSNFSFPKLTAATGIVAPTVYELYKNKEDLLSTCFLEIDAEIAWLLADVLKKSPQHRERATDVENYCWLLWIAFWRYLTADADRTRFYWAFYNSECFTPEVIQKRVKNYQPFIQAFEEIDHFFRIAERCDRRALVLNMIDGTISSAVKVFNGRLANDDATVNTIYQTVFEPMFSVLEIEIIKRTGAQGMTDKELKRLGRAELIDIIYELQKQSEEKDAQMQKMQATLNKRTLRISKAGSIAEAAIGINGVFEAAQAAADQYLASIREAEESNAAKQAEAERQQKKILEEANRKAEETILLAKGQAQSIIEKAEVQAAEKWTAFEQRANELIRAHEELQALMRRE